MRNMERGETWHGVCGLGALEGTGSTQGTQLLETIAVAPDGTGQGHKHSLLTILCLLPQNDTSGDYQNALLNLVGSDP
jgi:hypothetical protein